jgi:hypothetical protein
LDDNIEQFFSSVKESFNEDLPEKNCLIAIKDYLAGKDYIPSCIEEETPFTKIICLILQELPNLDKDPKIFALNIYQAKLLAADINQTQLEYICDMLIAYAYAKMGILAKAFYIYNDVLEISENSAIFNVSVLVNYLITLTRIENSENEDALIIINNILDMLQKRNNQAKVFYAMFEKLYIDTTKKTGGAFNESVELQKLESIAKQGELSRIFKHVEITEPGKDDFITEKLDLTEENEDDLAALVPDDDGDSYETETHE